MNIVDMSYGTHRTVLTRTLVTQLVNICGDTCMMLFITCANSSHIVGKLVTVGQGLSHGVQRRMISVVIFFRILSSICCFIVALVT